MRPSTRRILGAIAVGLVVVNLGAVATIAYPFSEMDHRPASEPFEHEGGEEYRVVANITTDGTTSFAVEGVVTSSGERYVVVQEEHVRTERYRNDGVQFERTVVEGEQADRMLRQMKSDPDREVVDTSRVGETVTVVTVADDPRADLAAELDGTVSIVTTQLRLAGYEPVGRSDRPPANVGNDTLRLRPLSGWYDGSQPYRLTDTSGEVRVETGTNHLVAAAVHWDLTRNTDTYLHYLLNRQHTVTQRVTYRYETENVSVETPDWVEAARR
jgi:hypothetical protein